MNSSAFGTQNQVFGIPIHKVLVFCAAALLALGVVMVASASIPFAERMFDKPLFFVFRHLIYLVIGISAALIVARIPIHYWFRHAMSLWFVGLLLLVVTLFFPSINGSKRWISLAGFTFQTSELTKLLMVIFVADYVVRRSDEVRFQWIGFLRLCIPMMLVIICIMFQPDLGASVVIAGSMMAVFFLAGAPLRQFFLMSILAFGAIIIAIIIEPYRFTRITALTDPWNNQLGSAYQLTRSLMAVGRGEMFGVGLGQSVFKLSYLPEAHTDFLVAIIGEELGFVGLAALILLEGLLVFCAVFIGQQALANKFMRSGYLAYGIACIFIIQITVNVGMNLGLLPTKGLTLPLISYGGSSLIVVLVMVSILYRINFETMQTPDRVRRYY